jgi:hypothetical protein
MTTAADTDDEPLIDEGSLTLRNGAVPVTIEELASLAVSAAIKNIEARFTIVETIRARAVMSTYPTDWVLFKMPEEQGGQITGYLMDAGAKRALGGAGVEVYDVSDPMRVEGSDPGSFSIRFWASGRHRITGQVIEKVLGSRASTDDACKGLTGVPLEDKVLKMARANCDGNVARKLLGLQNFPADQLTRLFALVTPPRSVEQCNRGRGFGSRADRQGVGAAPNVPPPNCAVCSTPGVWRAGKDGKPDFYFCPNHQKHPAGRKWFLDAAPWIKAQEPKSTPASGADAVGSGRGAAPQGPPAPAPDLPCSMCGVPYSKHNDPGHDWDDPGPA